MSVTYKLLGYGKCMLDSEADIAQMIREAKQLKENLVDVNVVVMETRESSDKEECENVHATQIVLMNDGVSSFNRKRQNILQSSSWKSELVDVGQIF